MHCVNWPQSYLAWLDAQGEISPSLLGDLAWTASIGRRQFGRRAAVVFRDVDSLKAGLAKVASRGSGEERPPPTRLAFVYTDASAEWAATSKAMYAAEPVVRAVFDQCDDVLTKAGGPSLLEAMLGDGAADPAVVGPGTYALQCAVSTLWSSVGVSPERRSWSRYRWHRRRPHGGRPRYGWRAAPRGRT